MGSYSQEVSGVCVILVRVGTVKIVIQYKVQLSFLRSIMTSLKYQYCSYQTYVLQDRPELLEPYRHECAEPLKGAGF